MAENNAATRLVIDLADFLSELDDSGDEALFGEYARVTDDAENGRLTVLHQTEPWGVQITVTPIVLCRNCGTPRTEHCVCHLSCPGQCPPEDSSDRVYRTFERAS